MKFTISYIQIQLTVINHINKHAWEDQQLVRIVFQRWQPISDTSYVTDWVITVHHRTHLMWQPIRFWHVVEWVEYPGLHQPIRMQTWSVTTELTRMRPMKTLYERRFITISAEIKRPTITWDVEANLKGAETNHSRRNILLMTTLGWVKY